MSKIFTTEEGNFISSINHTFYAILDGRKIPDIDSFYESISKALNFPSYFGENLDALDELLFDLDWIDQDFVMLFITNSQDLLLHDKNKREQVLRLFADIDNPYFEVVLM